MNTWTRVIVAHKKLLIGSSICMIGVQLDEEDVQNRKYSKS